MHWPFRRPVKTEDLSRIGTQTRVSIGDTLWLKVLSGLAAGILVGVGLGPDLGWANPVYAAKVGEWLALPGYLFLAIIQMIVIPLVLSSVFHGIAGSDDISTVKKLGLRVILYFIATTVVAISIGTLLAILIQPGSYMDPASISAALASSSYTPPVINNQPINNWAYAITTILPRNIFDTLAEGDLLRVVIFAGILGAACLNMSRESARPLINLAASLQDACMVVVGWVMQLAPYAVFGLIAQITARTGLDALVGMSIYMGTVLAGLVLMFCIYLIILKTVARMPLRLFLTSARPVQLLAFSTSSSAAIMPVTMQTAEEKLGVAPTVARMVVPMGATINMDGTALYQAVAAIFLAQVFGVPLGPTQFGMIMLTTVGASIGAPGTPGVGIVVLASILAGIGVPPEGIALIIGVDRILDMCRTTLNVTGDMVASTVMHRLLDAPALEPSPMPAETVLAAAPQEAPQ